MLRLVVWLVVLSALLYAVFWALDRRAALMDRHPRKPRPRRTDRSRSGPLGPDDDEDFLRELDRRRRGD